MWIQKKNCTTTLKQGSITTVWKRRPTTNFTKRCKLYSVVAENIRTRGALPKKEDTVKMPSKDVTGELCEHSVPSPDSKVIPQCSSITQAEPANHQDNTEAFNSTTVLKSSIYSMCTQSVFPLDWGPLGF